MSIEFDLGFLGGGQLARMSIQAAQSMGLRCISIDPFESAPASAIADSITAPLDDSEALAAIFSRCARVTLENEFVTAKTIERAMQLAGRPPTSMVPYLPALATIQDKFLQRQAMIEAGVPGPKAVPIEGDGTLAIGKIGFPMVLKARFGGYDGKGTRLARTSEEFEQHRTLWQDGGWMAEEWVDFKRELAAMVFVSVDGNVGCFPTVETIQENSVCDLVIPTDVDASDVAERAVRALRSPGLFGVEMFETQDGSILVNEIAPRPHNSGHYTLDWGGVSQFMQHVRLVLGLPPATVDGVPTAMANLFGISNPGDWRRGMLATLQADPGVQFHWYGKPQSRPRRKMGHINASGLDAPQRVVEARKRFYAAWEQPTIEESEYPS